MTSIQLAHTGQLLPPVLLEARALLQDAFPDGLTDDDWDHCLGGLHALARQDGVLVGHAALVQRRLLHQGRTLRAGYVEGLAVAESARRQGWATRLMAALEDVGRPAHDVLALASSNEALPFYAARGWLRWQGPTSALTPDGVVRTPDDDDAVHVLPSPLLDLTDPLACDWRAGDLW